jgi:hypothetical protein
VTFETADDVLEHFGVKGMHWGQRKARRAEKKAAKKEARAKADREYGDAVAKLVSGAAGRGNLVAITLNNRTQVMTGQEAAQMIMRNNGNIPMKAMWRELELDRKGR